MNRRTRKPAAGTAIRREAHDWSSRKVNHAAVHKATSGNTAYSFLFVHPDGGQLAEIGELLKAGCIRPVIDKVFPFEQSKEALAYLEQGRAKGKVVVRMT